MTSPPYWALRDYGIAGQLGLEPHPREYVEKLVAIFHDLRRVLKPSGSLFLNLGDTYWSRNRNPNPMLTPDRHWLQPKQLLLIPARVAIAMQEDGWIVRNSIIWCKPNGMPSSVKDRLANRYEYVFHFVKSRQYYYDLDAIRIPHRSLHAQGQSHRTVEGRTPHTQRHLLGLRNAGRGYVGHSAGKNPGDIIECPPETRTLGAILSQRRVAKVPWGKGWIGHPAGGMARILREGDARWLSPNGRNPGDFWTIPTRPFAAAHFAVFPERLCEQPIKAACPSEVCVKCGAPRRRVSAKCQTAARTSCSCGARFRPGIVFDPFAGAGTTLVVAEKLGRLHLGCELNPDYVRLARQRLSRTRRVRTLANRAAIKRHHNPQGSQTRHKSPRRHGSHQCRRKTGNPQSLIPSGSSLSKPRLG
jgi:DNA modification methylase